jgi:hypothetical protein
MFERVCVGRYGLLACEVIVGGGRRGYLDDFHHKIDDDTIICCDIACTLLERR